jgi:UDP-3-O-[3-hydroxymyristoyl] glucosamine N-acyltransferase
MGNNSTIREKLSITGMTTIGMNCAVAKDINESGIYIGIPAKKINNEI